jgi:hypothetical protein
MASVECGHVYIVFTTLSKPEPKKKIVLCICEVSNLFVWFNTAAQRHGCGQLKCAPGDHPALSRDCYLDLSRVTTFRSIEIANAKPRGPISDDLKKRICCIVEAGIPTLLPVHAKIILRNFSSGA